jgi:hypothetical protein
VGRLFAGALSQLGITPGVLAGHSLGEWTAMIVAGIYPEIDAFIASVRPGMAEVPDLVYVALGAPADRVAELLGDGVVVTHDNCPSQSVVCGPAARVTDVVERARAAGILARTLPFRTGFHSPMYAPYQATAREMLGRLEVRPASVPVWSATSLAPFPRDPDRMRDLVLRHLVEPVRFRQLTERLHESGVRAFVQVGPGSLTGFAEDTLRDRDRLIVATAVSQRDGLAQLRRVAAALWADGLSPRFDRLGSVSQDRVSWDGDSQGDDSQDGNSQDRDSQDGVSQRSVRLRLGGPLVRLTGAVEPIATAGSLALPAGTLALLAGAPALPAGAPLLPAGATVLPAGAPVLAEFGALMAETTAAAGAVAEALIRPPAGPALERPVSRPRAPGDGHDRRSDEITTTREFSLLTMPELADHGIIPQAEGWPEDSDRFPVVPMTTLLEVMADAALALAPGHVVVGFEKVRAMRWLTVAPATTARVHAASDGADRVRVSIEGYASCLALIDEAYPSAPPAAGPPRHDERPAPVTARELYEGGWMFHGPRFAGVADVLSVADDGITGTLLCLPARGALLDSAGQLIGHWMQVAQTVDQNVLPTGIGAVRLYGPQPQAGERLGATAWIRELAESGMRADAELRTGDGRVWCRIMGWTTRRFATDDAIWQVKLRPGHSALSRPCSGGWNVLQESWPDTASRELMMRRYLNAAERARYERLNPLQQRRWLLGCMAVKDAVRRWLWDRGAGPVYPAEVTVDGIPDDAGGAGGASGRPRVRGPFRAPHVSLAYRPLDGPGPACAVAICGDEPVDFTVDTGDDGTLLVAQPGRAVRPLDAATPVAAQTAKGHS